MLSGIGACHDARIVHRAVAAHMSQRKQCWVRGILCLWPCLASLAFEETSNWTTSCTAARTKRPSSCPTSGLLPKSLRLATSRAAWASTQRVAFALGSGLCQTLAQVCQARRLTCHRRCWQRSRTARKPMFGPLPLRCNLAVSGVQAGDGEVSPEPEILRDSRCSIVSSIWQC